MQGILAFTFEWLDIKTCGGKTDRQKDRSADFSLESDSWGCEPVEAGDFHGDTLVPAGEYKIWRFLGIHSSGKYSCLFYFQK